jgi:hypothetical protein
MANKRTDVKKKKRTMYFEERLFDDFSKICEEYEKSPSEILNAYMRKIVNGYEAKNEQE